MNSDKKHVLITGASGLLGHYLTQQFSDCRLTRLGRGEECEIKCDLEKETPDFTDVFSSGLDLVVHAAGTEEESHALSLNLEGTKRLLEALSKVKVKQFVYISSTAVYGKTEGTDITENYHCGPAIKWASQRYWLRRKCRKSAVKAALFVQFCARQPCLAKR